MASDRRYPWFVPLTRNSLPRCSEWETRRCRQIAEAVCRRTGTNATFDSRDGKLCFYYGDDMSFMAWSFEFKPFDHIPVVAVSERDIDAMVDMVRAGQRPREEKEAVAKADRAAQTSRANSARDRLFGAREKDVHKQLDQISLRRRGLTRTMVSKG